MDRKKVFIGLSGGVDSSVSAALLKEQGFDVTGVFIKVWQPEWFTCTWKEDRLDAMRVAAHLGINFITLDLEKEYKKEVVDYMIKEYEIGRTPNPDVMCNKYVKFGGFFDWAMKQGADFVATGHYARIEKSGNKFKMFSGKDQGKDQTYFLWTLNQKQISQTIFPVGNFEKSDVRKLARKFKLPTSEKKDSQGLCFVGKVDLKEFLSHYIKSKKGLVLDENRNVIGEHDGAFFLTLGERHGFRIINKTAGEKPYYIIDKNINENTVTVAHVLKNKPQEYLLESINWINEPIKDKEEYLARIRHLGELLPCKITINKQEIKVNFDEPVLVTSGQSVVIYRENECIGGGIVL